MGLHARELSREMALRQEMVIHAGGDKPGAHPSAIVDFHRTFRSLVVCNISEREAGVSVDNREHADLAAGGELVADKIRRSFFVDLPPIGSTFAQLCLHTSLRRFVTQLQA